MCCISISCMAWGEGYVTGGATLRRGVRKTYVGYLDVLFHKEEIGGATLHRGGRKTYVGVLICTCNGWDSLHLTS